MTDYLGPEDLLLVAERVVDPRVEVRDYGLLASAAARPQASAFGEDAYPDLATKAAALLVSLVGNHPLADGNKRLGWAATVVFLDLNGVDLSAPSQDTIVELVVMIAAGDLGQVLSEVAGRLTAWIA
jgi:death on curing protein